MIENSTNNANYVSVISTLTWFLICNVLLRNRLNTKCPLTPSNVPFIEKQKISNPLFNYIHIPILAFIARFIRAIPIYASD